MFVWYFGYVGDTFYPQTQLNISEQQMISQARSLSVSVDSTSRLVFVSAVDQLAGHSIKWGSKSVLENLRGYVGNLSLYGQVYGRIDLEQFNTTGFGGTASEVSINQEIGYYITDLSLKGVWLDHASVLYHESPTAFNNMMQNLSKSFPGFTFILNQAFRQIYKTGIITPATGTTWAAQTYISPSVLSGSYKNIPASSQFVTWNNYYPGRVLLHFDSYAQMSSEPMGVLADQSVSTQESAVLTLAKQGPSVGYTLLYPIIGGWTSASSEYHGTLYNSMTFGTYDRGTYSSFVGTMTEYP